MVFMSTGTSLNEVREAWEVLAADESRHPGEFVTRESPWSYRGETVSLARDQQGRRHLLIPIGEGEFFSPDTGSSGVQMKDRILLDGRTPRRFIDLICRKSHLNEHFSVLVTEVVQALDAPGRADQSIRAILDRWRELLARERMEAPSLELLTGVHAELVVLLEMAEVSSTVVDAWVGPDGERHDIVTPGGSIEVKGTRGRTGRQVEIHGLEQLAPLGEEELFLAYVGLERDPNGKSVLDLVELLEHHGCSSEGLHAGLLKVGISSEHHEAVREIRLSVRDRVTYRVDADFPRIIPATFPTGGLPPGVLSLSYTIDLTGETPRPMPAEDWRSACIHLARSL